MKCPRCQQGDFFISKPYDLKNAGNIHKSCLCCGLKYSKEPGFYYGAMYVSYALMVAVFVILWVSMNLFFNNVSTGNQIIVILTVSIILTPYAYALSKIIWINLFYRFDEKFPEKDNITGSHTN